MKKTIIACDNCESIKDVIEVSIPIYGQADLNGRVQNVENFQDLCTECLKKLAESFIFIIDDIKLNRLALDCVFERTSVQLAKAKYYNDGVTNENS